MTETAASNAQENPFRVARLNDSSDFDPELDVESLNEDTFKAVLADVHRASGRKEIDAGQVIPVLLSAPGYGKTHLLGRLASALADRAFFVFVGAISDPRRPLQHIQWNVVEALFESRNDKPCVLHRALADMFRSSTIEHVKQLPDSAVRQKLLRDLADGSDAVLQIAQAGRDMASFRRLADSAAAFLPHLRGTVVRALVLGWSPENLLARRWLRGESLSEEEADVVGLGEDAPEPLDVLRGIAAIFQYGKPMVICCDQVESTLKESEGPRQLTTQLMELLHGVPNTFAILSCLEGEWGDFSRQSSAAAFLQRIRPFNLDLPKYQHAADLIERRLKRWPAYDAKRERLWPFDSDSLQRFMTDEIPSPRALIRLCAQLFERWAAGNIQAPIPFGNTVEARPDAELFLKEWADTLEQIQKNPLKSPDHVQEPRFYSALREVMTLARIAGEAIPAVHVLGHKDSVLGSASGNPRYGMKVELKARGATVSVVAAVTTLNGGAALYYFIEELEKATKSAAGAIFFHPRQTFHMGPVARQKVLSAKDAGRLIVYALEDHRDTFDRLECTLSLLERAHSGELILGTKPVTFEACQRLILDTKVIRDLDLFTVLATWTVPKPEQAAPKAEPQATAEKVSPAAKGSTKTSTKTVRKRTSGK